MRLRRMLDPECKVKRIVLILLSVITIVAGSQSLVAGQGSSPPETTPGLGYWSDRTALSCRFFVGALTGFERCGGP